MKPATPTAALVAVALVLALAGGVLWSRRLPQPPWDPADLPTPPHRFVQAWDGGIVEIEPPPLPPPAFFESRAWRAWWPIGNVTSLDFTSPDGTRHVVEPMGKGRDAAGDVNPFFQSFARYRPDGTLAARSGFVPGGNVDFEWTSFAADGVTPLSIATFSPSASRSARLEVRFLDASGEQERGLRVNDLDEAWWSFDLRPGREWRTLHGGNAFDRTAKPESPED